MYYPLSGLTISPAPVDFEDIDDGIPVVLVENPTFDPMKSLQEYIIITYSHAFGLPPVIFTEFLWVIFLFLTTGALTGLLARDPFSFKPNSRTMKLYNEIVENPGITATELAKITETSRGTTTHHINKLETAGKVRKVARKGMTCLYAGACSEDESIEFMQRLITREKPHKIFTAIAEAPGISQTELIEKTSISQSTLQWHLSQLARYNAVDTYREKNFIHYTILPEYLKIYQSLTSTNENNVE
ncbi:winged helix-turn-helix transcriptional regulator [Methanorbis rubei]